MESKNFYGVERSLDGSVEIQFFRPSEKSDGLRSGSLREGCGEGATEVLKTADLLVENRDSSQDQGWKTPSCSEYSEPESAQASEDPSDAVSETNLVVIEGALQKFFPGELSAAGTNGKAIEMQVEQPEGFV
ncbi:hypothetical protein F0562_001244 [Nyssa sinensis]|uniref:Uncharacterized protein n=1 Tax=Nyssa sinensis TaxID=561372 RepID=A0A5J5C376_9ASTE|nr:hypothetical protein F0562_001244 [Nyssa sinensis]